MKIIKKGSVNISCFCLLFFSCVSYGQNCPDSLLRLNDTTAQYQADILFNRAEDFFKGRGVRRNPKKAVRLYKQAAKLGHYEAQRMMFNIYRYGYGVKRNVHQANHWQQKALSTYLEVHHR